MPAMLNLTGRRFNKLIVLHIAAERKNGHVAWVCECDCGKRKTVLSNALISGDTQTCGCGKLVDIPIGSRFGRLTVKGRAKKKITGRYFYGWLCICDCGNQIITSNAQLRSGDTRSCGCWRCDFLTQRVTRHGHTAKGVYSPIYHAWRSMIARCTNPRNRRFKNYGGRGIKVYDSWRFGEGNKTGSGLFLEYVLAHLGERPPGMSIDRFPDNDGNYEPGNIRWATPKEQNNNKRRRGAKFTDRIGKLMVSEAPDTAAFTLFINETALTDQARQKG